MRDKLHEFIATRFGVNVTPDQPLLGAIIDSVGIFALVEFIESTFQIRIPDAELTTENLATLALSLIHI